MNERTLPFKCSCFACISVDESNSLQTSPEVALTRLKKRGRGEEHLIAKQYIDDLHQLHEDWLIHGKHALPAPVIGQLEEIYQLIFNKHFIVVVDADKDLEEMKEAFIRQENIVIEKGRLKQEAEDKENVARSVGCKRVNVDNDGDNIENGRKKMALLEKGQI